MIKHIAIDECLAPGTADVLQAFLMLEPDAGIKVHHLRRDLGFGSRLDDEWLPALRPASAWLVVTCDVGRGKVGPPLPKAAASRNIAVLWLYGKLGERPMMERVRSLLIMWPDIRRLVLPMQNGRRWRIKCRASSGYRLEAWPEQQPQRVLPFMVPSATVADRAKDRGEAVGGRP